MRVALEVIFGIALVMISAPFAFSLWSRRGEKRPDRPGEKSVATFHGGERYVTDDERALAETEGFQVFGEGLSAALAEELRARGAAVDEPDGDDYGWGFIAGVDGERGHVRVGRTEEEDTMTWILDIVDPTSGGPGPAKLIALVRDALAALEVRDIEWQRR